MRAGSGFYDLQSRSLSGRSGTDYFLSRNRSIGHLFITCERLVDHGEDARSVPASMGLEGWLVWRGGGAASAMPAGF